MGRQTRTTQLNVNPNGRVSNIEYEQQSSVADSTPARASPSNANLDKQYQEVGGGAAPAPTIRVNGQTVQPVNAGTNHASYVYAPHTALHGAPIKKYITRGANGNVKTQTVTQTTVPAQQAQAQQAQ